MERPGQQQAGASAKTIALHEAGELCNINLDPVIKSSSPQWKGPSLREDKPQHCWLYFTSLIMRGAANDE